VVKLIFFFPLSGWKKIRIRDKHPGSTTQNWIFMILFVSVRRTKSRKEKNKLASRACRLKKKAQHEANKLKLHGLEEEHSESFLSSKLQISVGDPPWFQCVRYLSGSVEDPDPQDPHVFGSPGSIIPDPSLFS
jgi:hypothetical protein